MGLRPSHLNVACCFLEENLYEITKIGLASGFCGRAHDLGRKAKTIGKSSHGFVYHRTPCVRQCQKLIGKGGFSN